MRNVLPLLVAASLSVGAHAAALKPLTATYTVARDGKQVGDSTYSLAANPDGTWTLRSETHGTSGMARLAGLDVREESMFNWRNDSAAGIRYDYRQDATFKHSAQTIDFDQAGGQAQVKDSKGHFEYAIPPGTMDRASLYLVLGHAAAIGNRELTVPVAGRDHVEQQHFVAQAEEEISVPAGKFKAIAFERVDMRGKARTWYSPTSTLPLRIEKTQGDGSTILLELKSR
ncbi:MAG: DUF3108 domain-containing protein [Rudaea sp.]